MFKTVQILFGLPSDPLPLLIFVDLTTFKLPENRSIFPRQGGHQIEALI